MGGDLIAHSTLPRIAQSRHRIEVVLSAGDDRVVEERRIVNGSVRFQRSRHSSPEDLISGYGSVRGGDRPGDVHEGQAAGSGHHGGRGRSEGLFLENGRRLPESSGVVRAYPEGVEGAVEQAREGVLGHVASKGAVGEVVDGGTILKQIAVDGAAPIVGSRPADGDVLKPGSGLDLLGDGWGRIRCALDLVTGLALIDAVGGLYDVVVGLTVDHRGVVVGKVQARVRDKDLTTRGIGTVDQVSGQGYAAGVRGCRP
ncbi:MAG: hypothetical protein A4E29_00034 [Methanomassiliicoccales archaeon PtaB.Bin134]|nr:MAG: hypothetical protein A4E29_00034 [Methanomassiliicoccales archaeon PtaB.Bin134]